MFKSPPVHTSWKVYKLWKIEIRSYYPLPPKRIQSSSLLLLFLTVVNKYSCVWYLKYQSTDCSLLTLHIYKYVNFCVYSIEFPGFSSVQFSHSVTSDSLRPHESQHARPPCLSPNHGVYSNPCPSSHWCHPAISSSVVPFSSCPQSLPASGSFPVSQLFSWGGQNIGVSSSTQSPTFLQT